MSSLLVLAASLLAFLQSVLGKKVEKMSPKNGAKADPRSIELCGVQNVAGRESWTKCYSQNHPIYGLIFVSAFWLTKNGPKKWTKKCFAKPTVAWNRGGELAAQGVWAAPEISFEHVASHHFQLWINPWGNLKSQQTHEIQKLHNWDPKAKRIERLALILQETWRWTGPGHKGMGSRPRPRKRQSRAVAAWLSHPPVVYDICL